MLAWKKRFCVRKVFHVRTLTIQVSDSSPPHKSENRSVLVGCADTFVCKAISYPNHVILHPDENYTSTFRVELEALFLGVTQLNVTIGDEVVQPYQLRIVRSNRDEKVTLAFSIFIAIFVLIITFMMGTQLELGFLLAEYGLPADAVSLKLALFAVSTCPGGGKSSFWTIIFGGNLDLSISMTFTQTIAALFMMPLWMGTLGKHFTDAHGLVTLMIPNGCGMVMAHYRPQYIECISKWIKRLSWAAMIVISAFAIYANYYIFWLITWPIVLCGCALPWLGYLTALFVAVAFKQTFKDCITIAIETGIQNIGIAMLLMMWCLPEPEASIAVTVIFVVAIMTDKPLVMIWLGSKAYAKWCKGDTVKQVEEKPEKVMTATTFVSSDDSTSESNGKELDNFTDVIIDSGKKPQ
ncbi:sodium bile acid symporter family protein [Ancylostoma ceylanicum]|uniref:Sodium bile acid symporter family protein n=1 Tax=Ancylostoma ceylanicum TaxID=53326 RepID=A0A0D6LGW5_9BILA|nr:sodium bile acid symporter family protein [Ancylostoma ceylanicum]